jgi:hypothetical protein
MGTGGPFPGAKSGRGVTLTIHPYLVRREEWVEAITPLPPSASMACSGTALLFFTILTIPLFFSCFSRLPLVLSTHATAAEASLGSPGAYSLIRFTYEGHTMTVSPSAGISSVLAARGAEARWNVRTTVRVEWGRNASLPHRWFSLLSHAVSPALCSNFETRYFVSHWTYRVRLFIHTSFWIITPIIKIILIIIYKQDTCVC